MRQIDLGSHDHAADADHRWSSRFGRARSFENQQTDIRAERVNFQMIFQDPYASLNPRMTVYDMLSEAIRTRQKFSGKCWWQKWPS